LVAAATFAFAAMPVQGAAAEQEVIVEVRSAVDIANYLKEIGFIDIPKHPERLQSVPRTRILRVPKMLKNVWGENVKLRKSVFYRLGLSGILQVNESILDHRKRLMSLSPGRMSARDQSWVSEMLARYKIAKNGELPTKENMSRLIHRVDILPPSMVLAQAAIESAWLQSRFARK
jgi:Bax protein